MFLLDTDTISLMQFGHPVVLKRAASHPETSLFISSISVQEQMKGWIAHAAQTRTRLQLADWHDHLVNRIFPVWKRSWEQQRSHYVDNGFIQLEDSTNAVCIIRLDQIVYVRQAAAFWDVVCTSGPIIHLELEQAKKLLDRLIVT